MKIKENKMAIITTGTALIIGLAGGFGLGRIGTVSADRFQKFLRAQADLNRKYDEYKERMQPYEDQLSLTQIPTDEPITDDDIAGDSTNTDISFNYIDTSELQNLLTDGVYRCGTEFEPGEYYILSLYGAEAYYDVSNSPDDFSWSQYRIMRKINAKSGQYIKLCNAILVPSTSIDVGNWEKYGVFLVGKDLAPGDYKIEAITNSYRNDSYSVNMLGNHAAYQISNGSPEATPVESSLLFDKQSYISLRNGQYIMINNAHLSIVE